MATGLAVAATDPIRSFLSSAAAAVDLPADLRDLASNLTSNTAVSYRSLRTIWCATSPDTRPPLGDLLHGADFVLPSPKPREKSDELKARLEKLREIQERKEYAELIRDVTPSSKDDAPEPFSSYKDQIGFGLHIVVIMFTGYLVGFAMFKALFNNSAILNAAGGILGLVGGMLVETILFIIRSSRVKSWPLFQDRRKLSRRLKRYRQLVVGAIRGLSLWKSRKHLFGFKCNSLNICN